MTSIREDVSAFDLEGTVLGFGRRIAPEDFKAFLWTVFFGLLAHGSAMVSFFVNEDAQSYRFHKDVWASFGRVGNGRWFAIPVISLHEGFPFQFPLVLLFIVFISACGVLLARMLRVRTSGIKVLVASLLITYPAFAAGIGYNFFILAYAVSVSLAIVSVWLANKGGMHVLSGAILLCLSIAIYQTFIAVAFSICTAILLMECLESDFSDPSHRTRLLKKAGAFAVYALAGGVLYLLSTKAYKWYFNIEFLPYKGADQIGHIALSPGVLKNMVMFFLGFFLRLSVPPYLSISAILLCLLAPLCICVRVLSADRSRKAKWLKFIVSMCVFFMLLPSSFVFPIIAPKAPVALMQTYGICIIFAVALVLTSNSGRWIKNLGFFLALVVLLGFINRSNALHYKAYLYTQATFLSANRLLSKIEALPEFSQKSRIAVLGELPNEIYRCTGTPPFDEKTQGWRNGPVGFQRDEEHYKFANIVGFLDYNLNTANEEEIQKARSLALDMPVYPSPGSVKAFGDLIVVKLSHELPTMTMTRLDAKTCEFEVKGREEVKNVEFSWYLRREDRSFGQYAEQLFASLRGEKVPIEYGPSSPNPMFRHTFTESGTYRLFFSWRSNDVEIGQITNSEPFSVKVDGQGEGTVVPGKSIDLSTEWL
ncbi:MAG TPA: glucosyltransferase domain-containing protein [Candidatus Sumerlaeota bacterium]|nr:glucosyltransferase domain-containing protein [Candidatus Sumerlaeota bacterium]HPS00035.1 glucosyltransferase domain-containing protein [Candidatus Sumerlaeota bacterium]